MKAEGGYCTTHEADQSATHYIAQPMDVQVQPADRCEQYGYGCGQVDFPMVPLVYKLIDQEATKAEQYDR